MKPQVLFQKNTAKKIHVTTNGCSENRIDSAKMESFFKTNEWPVTSRLMEADIILFNACGLTLERENHSLSVLSSINHHKKISAQVIVCGCLPVINRDRIQDAHPGLLIEGSKENKLEEIFESQIKCQSLEANYLIPEWHPPLSVHTIKSLLSRQKAPFRSARKAFDEWFIGRPARRLVNFSDNHAFSIKISTGCLDTCTFCGVRMRRGRLSSKPIENVLNEYKQGVEKGFDTFTLIGTDVGAYGRDQGTNLIDLLKHMINTHGNCKLRLPNVNPRWLKKMFPDFLDIVETGKIELIGCGVQSGSDRMLRLMNRKYEAKDYIDMMTALKKANNRLHICTNIIVGYPEETDEDFQSTVSLLKQLRLTWAYIHKFSPRPEKSDVSTPTPVPEAIIEKRYQSINNIFLKHLRRTHFGLRTSNAHHQGDENDSNY